MQNEKFYKAIKQRSDELKLAIKQRSDELKFQQEHQFLLFYFKILQKKVRKLEKKCQHKK